MLYNSILVAHVAAGLSALILGLFAILSQKGGKLHKATGKWFVYCMVFVGVSSIALTYIKPNSFFFSIAIFTLFLVYAGVISLKFYRSDASFLPSWKEKIALWLFLVFSVYMWGKPVYIMLHNGKVGLSVSFIFGIIMFFSIIDLLKKINNNKFFTTHKKAWLLAHIGNISGAYIATLTAFLVNNIQLEMWWLVWLSPTVIGGVFIAYYTRKWRTKLRLNSIKTTIILVLFSFSTQLVNANIIKGFVVNQNNEAVSYVNIGFNNTNIGTVSNELGNFELAFNPLKTKENTLLFSCVGYEVFKVEPNELEKYKIDSVYKFTLIKKAIQLSEAIVRPSELKSKKRGNASEKSTIKVNLAIADKANMNLGSAIGKRFNFGSQKSWVDSIAFYVAGNNFDTLKFRINFYDISWGKPSNSLSETPIIHELVNFKKGWVEIDLKKYNLTIKNNIVAAVEWIGASKKGNALYLNMNFPVPGATHFYRFGSQNKWKRYDAMSSSLYLVTTK